MTILHCLLDEQKRLCIDLILLSFKLYFEEKNGSGKFSEPFYYLFNFIYTPFLLICHTANIQNGKNASDSKKRLISGEIFIISITNR